MATGSERRTKEQKKLDSEEIPLADGLQFGPVVARTFKEDEFQPTSEFDDGVEIDNDFLVASIEQKLALALHYMDASHMQDAGLSVLTKTFGTLLDRRQLLKGEPTQIVATEDRAALNTVLPKLLAEAERRGLTVPMLEGQMEVVEAVSQNGTDDIDG